jgi:hypothetical protein
MVHNKFTLQLLHTFPIVILILTIKFTEFLNKGRSRVYNLILKILKSGYRYPLKNTMEKRKVYESFVENREHT